MKNILLLVHDDDGEEARFQAALDVTRALSGHLSCFDITQIPVAAGIDFTMAYAGVTLLADQQDRETRNKAQIQARLAKEDVAWGWIDAIGDIAPLLKAHADLADLIVLNTKLSDDGLPGMKGTVSDVVIQTGKPVLAVPESAHGIAIAGPALIAWNGSHAVAEAMRAATPLLALAESVTIVQIGKAEGSPPEEAAAYLSRHGVHSRIEYLDQHGKSVADELLAICKARRPGYCVMGAYGHSRLRECLFGGTTRTMLEESPVPLLLAH